MRRRNGWKRSERRVMRRWNRKKSTMTNRERKEVQNEKRN